ncbi:hypothetical protein COU75_01580 [Candidatus Peregrinibacteria bacterium CG10_big_fil_rev_8_21_14_0_10_42_8]|nr:MAG: hypothetical protein COU75_01580 [Candidatus Peregrinibacteria bacterium CG10_big_fil_rev_8_21_14_0_10_42_8]
MYRIAEKALAVLLALLLSNGGITPVYAAVSFDVRTIDGSGNNTIEPLWGSTDTHLLRLTSTDYADGISEPRGGTGAISARVISNEIAAQSTDIRNTRGLSDMFWTWGQFVDHDIDLTDNASPAEAYNIAVPTGDPYFDPLSTGTQTIGFNRSVSDSGSSPRQQLNQITAYLDASNVYGSDVARADTIRAFSGGLLRVSSGNFLPFNTSGLPNAMSTSSMFFLAGDIRANEQPGLTALHTLFVREHNRIATELRALNPLLTDDELYETARLKVGAIEQAITYNDFLPSLFGSDILPTYSGYNPSVDAGIANEFSTAAYRLGHSMISPTLLRLDGEGLEIPEGHVSLLSGFFNPAIVQQADIDPLLRGLSAQVMQEVDTQEIDALRNFLFGPPGSGGFDLVSLNIQRGRDHGLAGYNQARRDLGLTAHTSFSDITSDSTMAAKLDAVYGGDLEAIDLWVGGLAEDHLAGSSLGETITTILKNQFTRIRDGDRFWYENYFTGSDLLEIQSTTLKDVIERNTDVDGLQDNVFFAVFPEADLSVSLEVNTLTLSGSLMTAEVQVGNTGPLTASGITVTIPVPSHTTFTSTGSFVGCSGGSGTDIICTVSPLASGESRNLDVVFNPLSSGCFADIDISATVSALQQDSYTANNSASSQTYYACPGPNDIDLSIEIGSSVSAERSGSFSAMATVTNNGPAFATGATMTISIPAGLDVNSINAAECLAAGNTMTCSGLDIAYGDTFSVEIELNIPESFTCPSSVTIEALALVGQQQDYFSGNDSSEAVTIIECEPENDLSISLTGNSTSYTATVSNNGPATAVSPVVSTTLPSGVRFSTSGSSSGCVQNGSIINCSISPLHDGELASVTILFIALPTLSCGTNIAVESTVSSTEKELNESDNTASAHTELICDNFSGNDDSASHRDPLNRDTVGRSTSHGSTRGKGAKEALLALSLLGRMNGMHTTVSYTGHFRMANNAAPVKNVSGVASDRTVIIDGYTEQERHIICGMKRYIEEQDPRGRKTPGFRQWLAERIAHELHRTTEEVTMTMTSNSVCQ